MSKGVYSSCSTNFFPALVCHRRGGFKNQNLCLSSTDKKCQLKSPFTLWIPLRLVMEKYLLEDRLQSFF
ncbi:unnamed protein product [Allacma fusca]|uniref:Uncharacterized protein n=1 Tax=Allacma fusca TaxID=39272 RepID=A0A8J2NNB1_9HEXA|nr:unnamed protein product [Allacma fusca]